MAKYKLSNTVKDDLVRIYQYGFTQFGELQADLYYNSFFDCFEIIAIQPYAFEAADYIKKDIRKCVCGVDTIYFKINTEDNVVEILTIVGRQDYKYDF
jgi:toxin ParE1/3/4